MPASDREQGRRGKKGVEEGVERGKIKREPSGGEHFNLGDKKKVRIFQKQKTGKEKKKIEWTGKSIWKSLQKERVP